MVEVQKDLLLQREQFGDGTRNCPLQGQFQLRPFVSLNS